MDFAVGDSPQPRLGQSLDRSIDEFEHGSGRAERLRQRQPVPWPRALGAGLLALFGIGRPGVACQRADALFGGGEIARVGALEAEDRLFEIADGEQRAQPLAMATLAREELLDQRADDRPLVGIGILRLVDQHMLGRLVELIAHPFAHARLAEQRDRRADQIVEIDRAEPPLCLVIGGGIVAPDDQRGGEQVGIGRALTQAQQMRACVAHFDRQIGIIGVSGEQLGRIFARLALGGERYADQIAQHPRAHLGCGLDPAFGDVGVVAARRRAPRAVRRRQPCNRIHIKGAVAAGIGDLRLNLAERQIERAADERADARAHRQIRHRSGGPRARQQELFGLALAQAQAQRADGGDGRIAPLGLCRYQHFGQCIPRHHRFFARLDRPETRH